MVLESVVMLSGFALGLFVGIFANLINIIISAFARWVLSG